ncbi:hypothetical protein AVEN_189244-1 [Araneus ventricosus]|uniref:Uncharacterized protein n=1 Tax=Araneus ventricosus TaxID=182803 RepID=A0A4Y2V8U7_ARAVE|nr:hypothetical protein AVEN_13759-1 [Araneus ventricosus]GBO20991.1 hypothetical protein AVEN_189244-1 [Araneus ventricosus]
MEFLEHGKEIAIVSFKNHWKLAWRNGNAGIQTNSKSNISCADSNLGTRCEGSGKSKDLPTLRSHVEGRNGTRNLPTRRKGVDGFSVKVPGLLADAVPVSPSSDSLTDAWAPTVHKLFQNQAFCGLCDAQFLCLSTVQQKFHVW